MADKQVNQVQIVWGVVLILAGLGVFYRIPRVMYDIEQIPIFGAAPGITKFCFYFIGVFLIGGGCKKLLKEYRKSGVSNTGPR
jgi:hypothetical protein